MLAPVKQQRRGVLERDDDDDEFPYAEVLVLFVILLSEGVFISMLFSYVAFFVEDLGIPKEQVASHVGWVASAFSFAQFLSSFFWGVLSNKVGRRPCLLFGLVGNIISVLAFGMAKSFLWAVIARAIAGLMNGNVGIAKSYIQEITNDKTSKKAYSLLGSTFGVGVILGSTFGGGLSRLHRQYPNSHFFAKRLFVEYPYLPPCIAASLVMLGGLIVGFIYLRETLDRDAVERMERATAEKTRQLYNAAAESIPRSAPLRSMRLRAKLLQFEWQASTLSQLLTRRTALMANLAYAILGGTQTAVDEIFPVLLKDVKGVGLEWGPPDIGKVYFFAAFYMLFQQTVVYHRVALRVGLRRILAAGSAFVGVLILCLPFVSTALRDTSSRGRHVAITFWVILRFGCLGAAFTSVMNIVSNSVPSFLLSPQNGLGQTMVALLRAIAPVTAGFLYDRTRYSSIHVYPFNQHYVFFIICLISLMVAFLAIFELPLSVDLRYEERNIEEEIALDDDDDDEDANASGSNQV